MNGLFWSMILFQLDTKKGDATMHTQQGTWHTQRRCTKNTPQAGRILYWCPSLKTAKFLLELQ